MSVEVIETGEVIEPMSRVEAERITTRIADKLDGVADSYEQVLPITDLESGSPPPPRKRVQDMPQEHWDKVNARQRVESMSAALYTISLLRNEAERARVHEAWVTNPEGAGGFGGPLHTPDMIRALADVMHVYANEMGDRNAR